MGTTKKQLTTWEAACIITGYGIGAGVLSMPYMAARNGLILSTLILILSLLASYVLHLMIAEIALKEGNGGQIISCLNRFLFRGKTKQVLTVIFFVLMAVILVTNLAAYISGAEEIIVGLLPIPSIAAKLLFYVVAASVVLFGLKAVGVSEKIAVTVIFALIAALAAASLLNIRNPLSLSAGSLNDALAYYGLAMFAMSAFFSVPQAVEGLSGDTKKIRKADRQLTRAKRTVTMESQKLETLPETIPETWRYQVGVQSPQRKGRRGRDHQGYCKSLRRQREHGVQGPEQPPGCKPKRARAGSDHGGEQRLHPQ